MSLKTKKEGKRGSYDFLFDKNSEILFMKWHDNNCFFVATNVDSIDPIIFVERWGKSKKKKEEMPQSCAVNNYT